MPEINGHIVETDLEGAGDWRFCAFFLMRADALDYARVIADDPTRARVHAGQMALCLEVARAA